MVQDTATFTERIGDRMSRTNITSRLHRAVYRLSSGRLGTELEGKQVLLLTTRGRRSGKPRTVPLMYLRDDDRFLVVASNAADVDHHPG